MSKEAAWQQGIHLPLPAEESWRQWPGFYPIKVPAVASFQFVLPAGRESRSFWRNKQGPSRALRHRIRNPGRTCSLPFHIACDFSLNFLLGKMGCCRGRHFLSLNSIFLKKPDKFKPPALNAFRCACQTTSEVAIKNIG